MPAEQSEHPPDRRKERLAVDCVRMIVHNAHLSIDTPDSEGEDDSAIDCSIRLPRIKGKRKGRRLLEVQVKSTSEEASDFEDMGREYSYQLEAATYNDLVEYDAIPHVLVLALFPKIEECLEFNDHDLRLRCRCFLVDMRGWAPTRNPYTRAVPFSEHNRLNSSSLLDFVKTYARR